MTTLDQKGTFTTKDGIICLRFIKTFPSGKTGYHRTSIEPGTDPAAVITAVNAHLAEMGAATFSDLPTVQAIVQREHTAQVITAFAAAVKTARPADIIKRDETVAAVAVDVQAIDALADQ